MVVDLIWASWAGIASFDSPHPLRAGWPGPHPAQGESSAQRARGRRGV